MHPSNDRARSHPSAVRREVSVISARGTHRGTPPGAPGATRTHGREAIPRPGDASLQTEPVPERTRAQLTARAHELLTTLAGEDGIGGAGRIYLGLAEPARCPLTECVPEGPQDDRIGRASEP